MSVQFQNMQSCICHFCSLRGFLSKCGLLPYSKGSPVQFSTVFGLNHYLLPARPSLVNIAGTLNPYTLTHHSLTHSLTYSLTHYITHSLTFIHTHSHSLTSHSPLTFLHSLTHIHLLPHSSTQAHNQTDQDLCFYLLTLDTWMLQMFVTPYLEIGAEMV